MVDQQPQPGLLRLMDYLESRGLRRALCTRNFEYVAIKLTPWFSIHATTIASRTDTNTSTRAPVKYLVDNHLPTHVFLPIITRDTPNLLPKPDPAGILHIASEWGLSNRAESMIMVSLATCSHDLVICA
jgi:phosphoglycolate phosphatase-like HAD superfamily hydrolase